LKGLRPFKLPVIKDVEGIKRGRRGE